jgi:Ca2+-binding RTX toxin-like protein
VAAATAIALLAAGLAPGFALAGNNTWQFPDFCGGALTLQHCIDDFAQPGDVVLIDTNAPVSGGATITKPLSLASAPGFDATVSGAVVITVNSGKFDIDLRRISVEGGINVQLTGGTGHTLTIDHVDVTNASSPSAPALRVYATVPATVNVTSSHFHATTGMSTQVYLESANPTGTVRYQLVGNRMTGHGDASSFGGVQLILDGSATTQADIMNNAIWDVGGCGCVGGAAVYIRVNNPATDDINVVGNTLDRAVTGVYVQTLTTSGGHYGLDLFDNIISHSGFEGVAIGSFAHTSELTFRAGYNDYFALGQPNSFGAYSAGSGNLAVVPGYAAPATGDLTLKASSPVIDKGSVCSPGGVAAIDAAGRARLRGSSVDMGAFEHGASMPTGAAFVGASGADTFVGTAGADIMCGYGGTDHLDGRGGNDYIDGGAAADHLVGGPGVDRLLGGSGDDALCARDGVHGNDRIDGGAGTDGYRVDVGDVSSHVEHVVSCH